MAFRDNSVLIRTAGSVNIEADGGNGDIYSGAGGATAFVIADGDIGKDNIEQFGADDSLITGKKIFDGNGDGYISFGPNGVLDVDRTSSKNAGNDQLFISGTGNDRVLEVRYLGTKGGNFVYADAGTRDALFGKFSSGFTSTNTTGGDSSITQTTRIDNDVADTTFDFSKGSVALLTDNALGLNFGGDTINGMGSDDLLIFTAKLYDSDGDKIVTFGGNKVLDLSGATGPLSTDPSTGPGGQFDVNEPNRTAVYYLGEKSIDGTMYYYYGTASAATPAGAVGGYYDISA